MIGDWGLVAYRVGTNNSTHKYGQYGTVPKYRYHTAAGQKSKVCLCLPPVSCQPVCVVGCCTAVWLEEGSTTRATGHWLTLTGCWLTGWMTVTLSLCVTE